MSGLLFGLIAFISCVIASNGESPHIDIYKNTLSNSRIIGGEKAERHQFPHQASLQWSLLVVYSHICGAILISDNWALTAGHCKASSVGSYRVVVGQLNQGENNKDVQVRKVTKFIVHPNFPGGVAANDIALLKLKSAIVPSVAVQAANLPTDEQCASLEDAILSGWGLTSIIPIPPKELRYARLPRLSLEDCKEALLALLGEIGPLDETQICTGAQQGVKQSACSGDSGGPLITTLSDNATVIGIVSWGIVPCGTKGAPSVYTNICSHRDFIESNIK